MFWQNRYRDVTVLLIWRLRCDCEMHLRPPHELGGDRRHQAATTSLNFFKNIFLYLLYIYVISTGIPNKKKKVHKQYPPRQKYNINYF